jgi:phage replication O-like protein O
MANPQLENGHLDIANELVDQFAKHNIPGSEMRIIWAIWRKTWCWKDGDRKKDFDWISITQFEKLTGIKRANIHTAIKSLLCKNIIAVENRNGKLFYGFNKRYNEWVLCKRIPIMQKHNKTVMQKHTQLLCKSIPTKDSITKDTLKDKKYIKILEKFNSLCKTSFRMTPEKKKQLESRLKTFSIEDIEQAIKNRLSDSSCMGQNSTGKIWAKDWNSLFRNDENLDRALNLSNSINYEREFEELGMMKFKRKYSLELAQKYYTKQQQKLLQ